jgi:uncharacterized membrane protein
VLSLGGTVSIDAKRRRRFGAEWSAFSGVTSSVPFAALVRGRNHLGAAVSEIGLWRFVSAVAVYALAFTLHGLLGHPLH